VVVATPRARATLEPVTAYPPLVSVVVGLALCLTAMHPRLVEVGRILLLAGMLVLLTLLTLVGARFDELL
jgi:hypothetical protein